MKELIEGIKTHAQANYNSNGWDMVFECFEDHEIQEVLEENNLTTLPDAVAYFEANIAKPYDDRRRDVQAEIF